MDKNIEHDFVTYMDSQWVKVDDTVVTVGMTEEGMRVIAEILKVEFPPENEEVEADEVCGELETDEAAIQIYSPVKGTIVEVNVAVSENPALITEDPYGDGWLFRVECENVDEVEDFLISAKKEENPVKRLASTDDDDFDDDDDLDDDLDDDDLDDDDLDDDLDDLDDDDLDLDDDLGEDDMEDEPVDDEDDEDEPPRKKGRR